MPIEIITALIGLFGSALGTVIGILVNTKLITYRIEQLEIKVNKHNNVIERMYEMESKETLLEKEIEVANHRIKDLENQNYYSDNKFLKEV